MTELKRHTEFSKNNVHRKPKRTHTINTSCVILSNSYKKFADDKGCCKTKTISLSWSDGQKAGMTKHIFFIYRTKNRMPLTLCVDWFGGGAFLLKSASEMASYGSVSSFRMVKRGLSHRFLESGASNLNTNASRLQKTDQMTMRYFSNLSKGKDWHATLLYM